MSTRCGPCERPREAIAQRVVAVEVQPGRAPVRQAQPVDVLARPDDAGGVGHPADDEVGLPDALQRRVGRVEQQRVAARPLRAVGRHRVEVVQLGRLAPDHPVAHARVAARGRGGVVGEVGVGVGDPARVAVAVGPCRRAPALEHDRDLDAVAGGVGDRLRRAGRARRRTGWPGRRPAKDASGRTGATSGQLSCTW